MDKRTIPLPKHLTPLQQMGASCSGALMTSVFTTPFDVVKITLQAEQKAVSGLAQTGTANLQASVTAAARQPGTTLGTVWKIMTKEGPLQLWRGLSPTLAMAVPATVIYYTAYDSMLEYLGFTDKGRTNYFLPMTCGGVARTFAVAAICPLEVVRTKKQAQSHYRYFELFKIVRGAVRVNGAKSLWSGFYPMIWRDVPFSALYWAFYEFMKTRALLQGRNIRTSEAFVGGATAGMVAAVLTTPFDVVKTYWQMEVGETGAAARRAPMHTVMKLILAEHGWKGLFVGVVPRVGKVAPACAIMISSYETCKSFFHRYNMR